MGNVRKNVWELGTPWAPDILWYARAVKVMKAKPLSDRLSWRFYGAIHGFNAPAWAAMGQPAQAADLPSNADQAQFWKQCQHGSWYFLPWHRGYLLAFEKVVRATMATLPGAPADWMLPYWNYFKPGQNQLPAEFASQSWPDGANDNPLFEAARNGPNDDGKVFVEFTGPFAVEESTAFKDFAFIGAFDGGSPGFGGPEIDTFTHSGGTHGGLEHQPHDLVHANVGGINNAGLMSDPDTAGLDPIFWLHHANIDRLWEVWKTVPNAQGDPNSTEWLGGPAGNHGGRAFVMPMPDGSAWTYTPADMTKLSDLQYTYDDLAPPAGVPQPAQRFQGLGASPAQALELQKKVRTMSRRVNMLGASGTNVKLSGKGSATRVTLDPPMQKKLTASMTAVPKAAPGRVFLNLENVRAKRDGAVFAVYVNLPQGSDPAQHPELRAGSIALFGARAASETDGEHAGEGLSFSLDISSILDTLHKANGIDAGTLDVQLVPRNPVPEEAQITIGRVSVYLQEG